MLTSRRRDPAGPALQILDAVISVARLQLLEHHPAAADFPDPHAPFDGVDLVARLLLTRLEELRDLADAYRRALADAAGAGLF